MEEVHPRAEDSEHERKWDHGSIAGLHFGLPLAGKISGKRDYGKAKKKRRKQNSKFQDYSPVIQIENARNINLRGLIVDEFDFPLFDLCPNCIVGR